MYKFACFIQAAAAAAPVAAAPVEAAPEAVAAAPEAAGVVESAVIDNVSVFFSFCLILQKSLQLFQDFAKSSLVFSGVEHFFYSCHGYLSRLPPQKYWPHLYS